VDNAGNRTAKTDQYANVTSNYTYDPIYELTQVTQATNTTESYTFDAVGNRLSSVGVSSYTNNSSNELTSTSSTTYTYDSNGNTQTKVVGSNTTTYSWDFENRMTSVTLPAGGGAAAYALGRLTSMTDGVGSEAYTYNNLGEMTQLQKVISGTTYTTGYAYNLAGQLSSITYPSTRVVQQSYDTIGRLCAVGTSGSTCSSGTTYATAFSYNAAFEVTGFNYGNGVAAAFGYTPERLLLQSLAYSKGGTSLFSTNYWYKTDSTNCPNAPAGNNGQIQCITDNVDSGRSVSYTYDSLYRLTSAVTNGSANYVKWGLTWAYDRYGNRLNQTYTFDSPPTNSLSFANPGGAQTNRPDGMCFDANGNLTAESGTCPPAAPTYAYDAENRLITYSGTAGTYAYDGNNLRVIKVAAGATTVYIFSGSKVIAEYDNGASPASPSREYIYSGAMLLAKIEGGASIYYHPDQLSNRVLTDSSGNTLGQRGHYPFGDTWYESGTTTKLQFTSYERDSESTNDYATARSYLNRFGRFSSPDLLAGSLGNPQSFNRYAYVFNDPIDFLDPLGMDPYQCGVPTISCTIDLNPTTTGADVPGLNGDPSSRGALNPFLIFIGGRKGGGGGSPDRPSWCPPGDACDPSSNPKRPQPPNPPQPPQLHELSFCAAESLGFGYVSLYSVEAPPFSIASALVSLGFGVGDATGACDWVAYKLNVLVSHMKGH
jgi:RHS repeat-associated protein